MTLTSTPRRLSEEFFPGSAEGSVAELPPSALKSSSAVAAEPGGLVYVARLERAGTHCVPSAAHCAGVGFSTDGGSSPGR
jgi:hypothetical protein